MDSLNTQSSPRNTYPADSDLAADGMDQSQDDSATGSMSADIKERVQHNVKKVAGQARDQANKTVETKKHALADQVDGLAKVMRTAAAQLDEQQQDTIAGYAHTFAGKLDDMVGTLHDTDIKTLLYQTRDLARRQPGLFVGGALVASFLLVRFLTSSDNERQGDSEQFSYSPSYADDYRSYQAKERYYE